MTFFYSSINSMMIVSAGLSWKISNVASHYLRLDIQSKVFNSVQHFMITFVNILMQSSFPLTFLFKFQPSIHVVSKYNLFSIAVFHWPQRPNPYTVPSEGHRGRLVETVYGPRCTCNGYTMWQQWGRTFIFYSPAIAHSSLWAVFILFL